MFKLDDIIGSSSFHSDPYPAYRKLRESDPVQWSDKWNCWVLTRYHDVRESLADARRFSNVGRVSGMFQNFLSEEERKSLKPLIDHYSRGLINVDPPDHTRIRLSDKGIFMFSPTGGCVLLTPNGPGRAYHRGCPKRVIFARGF